MSDQWREQAKELWFSTRSIDDLIAQTASALRSAYEKGVEDGVWNALNTAETSGWDEALRLLHKNEVLS